MIRTVAPISDTHTLCQRSREPRLHHARKRTLRLDNEKRWVALPAGFQPPVRPASFLSLMSGLLDVVGGDTALHSCAWSRHFCHQDHRRGRARPPVGYPGARSARTTLTFTKQVLNVWSPFGFWNAGGFTPVDRLAGF